VNNLNIKFDIVRPHRHDIYIDVDCCYRPSSLGPSVTVVSPQKRLNRSRCRLSWWLQWAQGSMYLVGVHAGSTWRIPLNCPCQQWCGRLWSYFDHLFSFMCADVPVLWFMLAAVVVELCSSHVIASHNCCRC